MGNETSKTKKNVHKRNVYAIAHPTQQQQVVQRQIQDGCPGSPIYQVQNGDLPGASEIQRLKRVNPASLNQPLQSKGLAENSTKQQVQMACLQRDTSSQQVQLEEISVTPQNEQTEDESANTPQLHKEDMSENQQAVTNTIRKKNPPPTYPKPKWTIYNKQRKATQHIEHNPSALPTSSQPPISSNIQQLEEVSNKNLTEVATASETISLPEEHRNDMSETLTVTQESDDRKPTNSLPEIPSKSDKVTSNGQIHHSTRQTESRIRKFEALCDSKGRTDDDLHFKKGDILEVDPSCQIGEEDWIIATNIKSKKKGYIPINYMREITDNTEYQEWWCDFDRSEACKMLMLPENATGTFLVRPASEENCHVLSIRRENVNGDPFVTHFKISKTVTGDIYIQGTRTFSNITNLIEYFKEHPLQNCYLSVPFLRKRSVPADLVEIDRQCIVLLEKLAEGYFGEVYKGKIGNEIVAVKTLKVGRMSTRDFFREAQVLNRLNHRRLITMYHVCSESEPVWIVTEFMPNGSLLKYLRNHGEKVIKFPTLINMASQIAEGMEHLDKLNLIHRDLRADNILLGINYEVKIGDFGLARNVDDTDGTYVASADSKFPIAWTAPEAFNFQEFTIKSDIWSFGVLLFELITLGQVPYPGMDRVEIVDYLNSGRRLKKSIHCPDEYYEIMLKCWRHIPEERHTFGSLFAIFDTYFFATDCDHGDT